jgi:hypothetical protein
MLKKSCEWCKKPFETYNEKKRFCSISCQNKSRWSSSEYREKMKKKIKKAVNTEGEKIRRKKLWENPSFKEKMKEIHKEIHNREDIKQKFIDTIKKHWADPEKRKSHIDNQKIAQNQLERKELNSIKSKEMWKDDEFKNNMKKKMRDFWSDPKNVSNHYKNIRKYKNYILPSGKIVKLQGYEPIVLNKLLSIYEEEDIIIGAQEISKEIGQIKYIENDEEHTYYPDFFIKSKNLIIEVKSKWTYDKWLIKNELKKSACLDRGFDFKFIVLRNAKDINNIEF